MQKLMEALAKADTIMAGIYKDYKKFFKYMGVGAIGTIADWALYFVLFSTMGMYYAYAVAISYSLGMIINFTLNKYYTFNNKYKKVHFQFASFAAVAIIGLALTEILLGLFAEYIIPDPSSFDLMAARVVVTFLVFVYNYIVNKRTTFKIFQ